MHQTTWKRLLCLLMALALCIGIIPLVTQVEASSPPEDTADLPVSTDDLYMSLSIACHRTNDTDHGDRYRALRFFSTDCNFPIVGMKLVCEFDRTYTGFNATDSTPRTRFDEASADGTRDSDVSTVTVTGSSEDPITLLSDGLVDLYFGTRLNFNDHRDFDFRITELILYVPLADGTVAEYTPYYPEAFTVPSMDDGSYYIFLGSDQAALEDQWLAWGTCAPRSRSIWKLQEDGTLIIEGAEDIPDYDTTDNPAPWMQYRDYIKKVVIRNGMRNIGYYAFYGCSHLEEVVFPAKFYYKQELQYQIRNSAFEGCTSLSKLSPLPDTGNAEIHLLPRAFANTAVKTFHIPPQTVISQTTFSGCNSLVSFTVDADNAYYDTDVWGALLREDTVLDPIFIFPKALAGEYHVPYTQRTLPVEIFSECQYITKLVLSNVSNIQQGALRNCSATEIYFPSSAPRNIAEDAFQNVTATVYYPTDDASWTADKMLDYGGNLTWVPHTHNYTIQEIAPTCTESGYALHSCGSCGHTYQLENCSPLGHEMGPWETTLEPGCLTNGEQTRHCSRCDHQETQLTNASGHSWQDIAQEGMHTCAVCGLTEGKYRIYMPIDTINDTIQDTIWVDGVEYLLQKEHGSLYVALTHKNATCLTSYTYQNIDSDDVHTQYPLTMVAWLVTYVEDGGFYTVHTINNFLHNPILKYAGCSIRIKGVKGIRMITGVNATTRKQLVGKGLADGGNYKLLEYGTLLAWAKDLDGGNPLTLGQPYVKSNYAYKRGVADPIYKTDSTFVYYTNVLVGFTNEQCKDDIAMRPYMIIEDQNGKQFTIYGGIIYRSIGYIAYQNRNAFQAGTSAYEYVWDIIHYVYGNQYDAEYKGKK